MEALCRKLPVLTGLILNHLDDQSLINCKIASKEISKYLEGTKLIKIRIIRKYRGYFEDCSESWNKVLEKAPVEIVDTLSIATQWCFRQETYPKYECISEVDNKKLEQKIVDNLPFSVCSYKKQWTPLLIATYYGCFNLCKFVIEITDMYDSWYDESNDGHSALHLAAHNQNVEICGLIMTNMDFFDHNRLNPLECAAFNGQLDMCKFALTNLGVKNPVGYHGMSPFQFAIICGHLKICEFYIANLDDKNPLLHQAAYCGHLDVYKLIMDTISDKNPGIGNDGTTPLHVAARRGHEEVCKFIMDSLVDKNPKNNNGVTPLDYAAQFGREKVCELIMESLEDKNPTNANDMTPLHLAALFGHKKVCELIMEKLEDKNPLNNVGMTPLHFAARHGQLQVCKLIMDNVVDKNPADNQGLTPRQMAKSKGYYKLYVIMLLKCIRSQLSCIF